MCIESLFSTKSRAKSFLICIFDKITGKRSIEFYQSSGLLVHG